MQRAQPGSVCGAGAGAGPGPGQRARGQAGPSLRHGGSLAPVRPGQQPQVKSNSQEQEGLFLWGLNGVPTPEKNPSPLLDKAGVCAYAEERSALGLWRAMER